MNILYKYYSSLFDVFSHLDKPSIKLARTASFNDPFEKQLSGVLAEKLATRFINTSSMSDLDFDDYISTYKNISKNYGMVSLTETHRNILMWAHYASSHRGVCIGYKVDFLDSLEKERLLKINKHGKLTPQRVTYDSKRFDLEQCDLNSKINNITLIMKAMSTKSDEWIYEKEHRCIVPFIWADKFTAIKKNEDLSLLMTIDKYIDQGYINHSNKLVDCSKDYFEFDFKNNMDGIFSVKEDLLKNDGVTMFKNINIDSIESIYIGCEFDFNKTRKLKHLIENNPERYGKIGLYKYEIDPNSFDLVLLPLVNRAHLYDLTEDMILKISQYDV